MPSDQSAAEQSAMAGKQIDAKDNANDLLELTLDALEDNKAVEIVPIALAGKSPLADHMVICSGTSSRHVATLAEKLIEKLKRDGNAIPRTEGLDQGDWALIDAGDIIIHIFRPEVREFYNLERMWTQNASESDRVLNG